MCTSRSATTPFMIKKIESSDSSSSSCSSSEPIAVATAFGAKEPVEIDASLLSAEGLQSLKKEDPFLYYSIPSVRRGMFKLDGLDSSASSTEKESDRTVKRCTRVSFECHTDLLMEDLFEDLDDIDDQIVSDQMNKLLLGLFR